MLWPSANEHRRAARFRKGCRTKVCPAVGTCETEAVGEFRVVSRELQLQNQIKPPQSITCGAPKKFLGKVTIGHHQSSLCFWRKHFLLARVPLAANAAPFGILVLKAHGEPISHPPLSCTSNCLGGHVLRAVTSKSCRTDMPRGYGREH